MQVAADHPLHRQYPQENGEARSQNYDQSGDDTNLGNQIGSRDQTSGKACRGHRDGGKADHHLRPHVNRIQLPFHQRQHRRTIIIEKTLQLGRLFLEGAFDRFSHGTHSSGGSRKFQVTSRATLISPLSHRDAPRVSAYPLDTVSHISVFPQNVPSLFDSLVDRLG